MVFSWLWTSRIFFRPVKTEASEPEWIWEPLEMEEGLYQGCTWQLQPKNVPKPKGSSNHSLAEEGGKIPATAILSPGILKEMVSKGPESPTVPHRVNSSTPNSAMLRQDPEESKF